MRYLDMRIFVVLPLLFVAISANSQSVKSQISDKQNRLAEIASDKRIILNDLEELRLAWIREQMDVTISRERLRCKMPPRSTFEGE